MNRREIFWLVGGLVIGLIVGVAVTSLAGDVPPLGGTAAKAPAVTYYLAKMSDVSSWLTEQYSDSADLSSRLSSAAVTVQGLVDTEFDVQDDFKNVRGDIDAMLVGVYGALTGAKATEEDVETVAAGTDEVVGPQDNQVSVCLALDDNPYSLEGPSVYLYVAVPDSKRAEVESNIPGGWEASAEPKNADLFWLLLSCYAQEE
ncbi:MAG: hypothetical protein JXB47_01290 [Anaerolineae bacterium]|nr:hypothetical protein [Anaerolineae bacterium]